MEVIGNLLNGTLVFSTALIFAAIGGMISERSGVINIGIEGFMVSGAFFAAIFTYYAENAGLGSISPWIGLLAAFVCTIFFSFIHAIASIKYKANQVVSGTVINILAPALTFFLVKVLFDGAAETPILSNVFRKISIPYLSEIPLLGDMFFKAYPTTYIVILLVIVMYFLFKNTTVGLRLRAVGEHPGAADTAGINVNRIRYISVMLSASIAALGGATIVLTTTSSFSFTTIAGQGFIALAAMIFGKWHPIGVTLGAILFGFAQALKDQLQIIPFAQSIPNELFYMLPYLLTLIVLIFAVGRSSAPAALGQPYEPGKR